MTLVLIVYDANLIQPMVLDLYLIDVRRRLIISVIFRLIIITTFTITTSITAWIHLEPFYPESYSSELHGVILFNLYTVL